jgi:transcriptional antiterminator NusG
MIDRFHGRWLAIRVRPNSEKAVACALRIRGYEEFLPTFQSLRRRRTRFERLTLPLFSGYVFCRFDSNVPNPIIATPGVLQIVGNGKSPVPLDDDEISTLKRVNSSGYSKCVPWPRLEIGTCVCINSGPLKGISGVLVSAKSTSKLVVSIPLLQRSVAITISAAWLSSTSDQRPKPASGYANAFAT